MVNKKGRTPSKNPKNHQTRIRMTEEQVQKLEFCSQSLKISKTDVINKGVDMVYAEIKKEDID